MTQPPSNPKRDFSLPQDGIPSVILNLFQHLCSREILRQAQDDTHARHSERQRRILFGASNSKSPLSRQSLPQDDSPSVMLNLFQHLCSGEILRQAQDDTHARHSERQRRILFGASNSKSPLSRQSLPQDDSPSVMLNLFQHLCSGEILRQAQDDRGKIFSEILDRFSTKPLIYSYCFTHIKAVYSLT